MKLHTLPTSTLAALLIGLAQGYFLVFCWGYIAAYTPLPQWLMDVGLRDEALGAVIFSVDVLISVVLSLLAAFVLVKLRPGKLWLYLLLAVLPGFIWQKLGVIDNALPGQFPASFVPGWLTPLLALPVAACVVSYMLNRGVPDNSFNPRSPGGSA